MILSNNAKERLIIALDYNNIEDAIKLIDELEDEALIYKVGLELFLNTKGSIIDYLVSKNKKIFLDLKFHDIPNTTAMASVFASKQNIFMFNVHSSGGRKMMQKCVDEIKKVNDNTLLIGVTVLTSLSEDDVCEIFHSNMSLKELTLNLAKLSKDSNLNGVVCSPREASIIKKECGSNFITVCPGVRPAWASLDDQERVLTPKEAMIEGCDYLVIGRPILKAENRKEACIKIIEEISLGLKELESNNSRQEESFYSNDIDRKKLIANALLDTSAVKLNIKEPFTFVSGIKSPIYCDNRYLIGFVSQRKQIVKSFIDILKNKDFDIIAGTATAGIPWSSFIAYELNKPLCYIRAEKKEHGRGKQIEGAEVSGKRVILIEDLISTGSSSINAFKALKEEGAIGLEIISIFEYEFEKAKNNFSENNIKFSSLSNFSTLIEVAKEKNYITEEELIIASKWNKSPDTWGL